MKCDGVDCKGEAQHLCYLRKSGAEVRLCGVCYTRFCLRGLLRTKGEHGGVIETDITGISEFTLSEFVKQQPN